MSPTTAEQNDLQQPDAHAPANEPNDHDVVSRRSFVQKNPLAKPLIFALVILVILAVGWYWWDSRRWESTDDAEVDGHIYPISARVGGQVIKVNFDDGQLVHKGDVLVVTDPTDYKVAVDRAQADYEESQASAQAAQYGVPVSSVGSSTQIRSASADMANAQAGVLAAQKQVEAAQAQIAEAQATAQKLNADVLRYRQLLDKREISQQQFDQATSSATAANATVTAREANLLAARAQVQQAQSRIEQARAEEQNALVTPKQVAATEARAKSADAQVLRYKSGQDLMAVVPLREIWVTADFKETQLAHMVPGQPVKVKVDTYGGRKWDAHVSSIGAATGAKYSLLPPENATGNYVKVVQRIPVRIDFDNSDKPDFNQDGLLREGMSVTPDVNVSVRPDTGPKK